MTNFPGCFESRKLVSARRRNQHARRVRYPDGEGIPNQERSGLIIGVLKTKRGFQNSHRQLLLAVARKVAAGCYIPSMSKRTSISDRLVRAAAELRDAANKLKFASPVAFAYNPIEYAWLAHEAYIRRYAATSKRVVFLGMNPGPFGMAQTGVPFGEIAAVRDWLCIAAPIGKPPREHPKRLITGFASPRTEISGQRLWRLFAERFVTADKFCASHFVLNYCPLAFLEASGANRTPDKLPAAERSALFRVCDQHLREVIAALNPKWLIGIGDFAMKRALHVFPDNVPKVGRILHPSPASPAANRDWAGAVTGELQRLGVWR